MICSPCISACSVPICTEQIIIGTITSVNTDVKIIIENKTTGRKQYVSTQSDGAGLVTLVTAGMGLMAEQTYEISVLLATAVALCDTETLTIGESTGKCISFQFENIKDNYGCQITFASQTLTPKVEDTQPGTNCICVTQEMINAWDGGGAKVYRALLSQTGTDDPTAIVFENTIGNIVWTRVIAGSFQGTLINAFPSGKFFCLITGNGAGDGVFFHVDESVGAPNYFDLFNYDTAQVLIDKMICYIEIAIYP